MKNIILAIAALFASVPVKAAGVLINGNQINPASSITISSLTVTGMIGTSSLTVTNALTVGSGSGGTIASGSSVTASAFFGDASHVTGIKPIRVMDFGATGNGVTDDTVALQAAIAANVPLYWPAGKYVISDTLRLDGKNGVQWHGENSKTIIVNKAPPNRPSVALRGTLYYWIDGVSIMGVAGFPNDAIRLSSSPTIAGSSFGTFENLILQPNGNGAEIRQANTVNFHNVGYWPSDGTGSGATADNGTRQYGILVSSSVPGVFANEIMIRDCNLTGVDPAAAFAALISMKVPALGSLDNITINNSELELGGGASNLAIDIAFGLAIHIFDNYVENSTITIHESRYVSVDNNYNPLALNFTGGSSQMMASNMVLGGGAATFNVGVGCTQCGATDSYFQHIIDSGTDSYFMNVRTVGSEWPGGRYPDKIPGLVIISSLNVIGMSNFYNSVTLVGSSLTVTGDGARFGTGLTSTGTLILYNNGSPQLILVPDLNENKIESRTGSNIHITAAGDNSVILTTFGTDRIVVNSSGTFISTPLSVGTNLICSTCALHVIGNIVATGEVSATRFVATSSVTASSFFGDGSHLTGIAFSSSVASGGVDFSTITAALATKASSGTDNTITRLNALATIGSAYTALSSMTNTSSNGILVNSSVTAGGFYGNGFGITGVKSVLSGGVDFSTITTALNTKLSSGAIPSGFVDFSTITTALATKASSGTDNTITRLNALNTIGSAFTSLSSMTNTSANGVLVNSSVTAGGFYGSGFGLTGVNAASVASGGVNFSTITTALATKASTGTDNTITRLDALNTIGSAFTVFNASVSINGTGAAFNVMSTFTVANSGIITAPSQPRISLSRTSNLPVNAGGSGTIIHWDTILSQVNMNFLAATSSDTVTVPAGGGGEYLVICNITHLGSALGSRLTDIYLNGSVVRTVYSAVTGTVDGISVPNSQFLILVAGDALKCGAETTVAASTIVGQTALTNFSVFKLW